MSNLVIVRAYEIGTLLLYLASFFWLLRMRNPLYLGAFIGATLVFGYDWVYCTTFFFNVTYNPDLLWIPGLAIKGIREPIAIPFAYGVAFGPFAVLLTMKRAWFDQRFGVFGYVIVWIIGAIGVMLYEVPVVHILHIWTYNQTPDALLWGVPWSDIWLAGNLVLICYCRTALDGTLGTDSRTGVGFSLGSEHTWKGLVMGGLAPWAAFYITFLIQLFWYSAAQPWVNVGRPF